MGFVDLNTIYNLSLQAHDDIWSLAGNSDREPKIYLHWSAGSYTKTFNEYHISITGDGQIYIATDNFADILAHTWRRNSGAVGVALCCANGAGSTSLGKYPPTAKQIEVMAQVINKVADGLWLTIDKEHVMTHGEAANNEDGDSRFHNPYAWWNDSYHDGDTRGDLEYLGTDESPSYNPWATDGSRGGDVLRGKANWYRDQNNK